MLFNQSSLFDRMNETVHVDLTTGAITPVILKERAEYTMKIKMLKTAPGSINGITIQMFDVDEEYDLPKDLADAFINRSYAKKLESIPEEHKVIEPEETKGDGDKEELTERSVDELKEIAKTMGIKGYSKLIKDELIQAIHDAVN